MAKEKFNLFNFMYRQNIDGKGVKKEKKRPPTFVNFFITLPRRFGKLLSINILLIVGNFPLIFPLIAETGYLSEATPYPASVMFGAIYNIYKHDPSPAISSLWGILGRQTDVHVINTPTIIFYLLGLLIIFTIGLLSTGCAYIMRNLVKGDSVSVVSDFFYAVKRNLRQGFILGLIDSFFCIMLVWDVIFFWGNSGDGMNGIMLIISLCMAVIYFFMRYYMYILLVTFDLSIFKILKNSLIFAFLGIWRNIVALLGIVVVAVFAIFLAYIYFPLGVAVCIVGGFSLCVYMTAYAAYPKIKTYMIDPYYKEEEFSYYNEEDPEEEPIFHDDVQ